MAAFDEKIEYEYVATNTTQEELTLEIVEHPARGWQVKKASHQWRREDADTLVFTVPLKPQSEAKITATILRLNVLPE